MDIIQYDIEITRHAFIRSLEQKLRFLQLRRVYKMRRCYECKGKMNELVDKTPEGVEYRYFKCEKCGEEILNMDQLHSVAEKYRELKRYTAKLSKWGQSLGVRIPKELARKYKFKDDEEVTIVPDKEGIRIIPL